MKMTRNLFPNLKSKKHCNALLAFGIVLFLIGLTLEKSTAYGQYLSPSDCFQDSITEISDCFYSDAAGWTVTEDANQPSGEPVSRGDPFIQATDGGVGQIWYWKAPRRYSENLCEFYGGSLSFEIRQSDPEGTLDQPDIVIASPEGNLTYAMSRYPGTDWTPYSIRLNPGPGWVEAPDADFFKKVLANATEVLIRGEYSETLDTGALGLVILRKDDGVLGFSCADYRPRIDYRVNIDPEAPSEGRRAEISFEVKNVSRESAIRNAVLDVVFMPEIVSGDVDQPIGKFETLENVCVSRIPSKEELAEDMREGELLPTLGPNAYGYRCSNAYLNVDEIREIGFFQEHAVPGVTDYFYRVYASDQPSAWQSPSAPIEVMPGTSELQVSVADKTESAFTGVEFQRVYTITNTGTKDAVNPVFELFLQSSPYPADADDLSVSVSQNSLESLQEPNEGCTFSGDQWSCKIVPYETGVYFSGLESDPGPYDWAPYLPPGASEQITVTFTPLGPGFISLSSSVHAEDYSGKRIEPVAYDEADVEVEGPDLLTELESIQPGSTGSFTEAGGLVHNLHPSESLLFIYTLDNRSRHAILKDAFFYVGIDGTASVKIEPAAQGFECALSAEEKPAVFSVGQLFICPLGDFEPEAEMVFAVEGTFEGPVYIEAGAADGRSYLMGVPVGQDADRIKGYSIGLAVEPKVQATFKPEPEIDPLAAIDVQERELQGVARPDQLISGSFTIGSLSPAILDGDNYLSIWIPNDGTSSLYSVEKVKGCEDWGFGDFIFDCLLSTFGSENPTEVSVEFSAVKPEYIGQDHCFRWHLFLDAGYLAKGLPKNANPTNACAEVAARSLDNGSILYKIEAAEEPALELNEIQKPEFLTEGVASIVEYGIQNTGNTDLQDLKLGIFASGSPTVFAAGTEPEAISGGVLLSVFDVTVSLSDEPGVSDYQAVPCDVTDLVDVVCTIMSFPAGGFFQVRVSVTPKADAGGNVLDYALSIDAGNAAISGTAQALNSLVIRKAETQPKPDAFCGWQYTGLILDHASDDDLPFSVGRETPLTERCTEDYAQNTATCWNGSTIVHPDFPGRAWCTYKHVPVSTYVAGPNQGKVYECSCEDQARTVTRSDRWQFHNPGVSRRFRRAGFVHCREYSDNSFECAYVGTEEFPILLGNQDGDPVISGTISEGGLSGFFFTHPATDIEKCPQTNVSHPAVMRDVKFSENGSAFSGAFQYFGVNVDECNIYTDEVLGWYQFEFHRVD